MILKSFSWKKHSIFYLENTSETWWSLHSLFQCLHLKNSPKRFFQKSAFSDWPNKKAEDFSIENLFISKKTVFIPKNKALAFLRFFFKEKKILESADFEFLSQQIENPNGEVVRRRLRTKSKVTFDQSSLLMQPSEKEILLLTFRQQLFELAELSQKHILFETGKPLSTFEYEQFQSGIRILQENLEQLNPDVFPSLPDFIDIEVFER